MRWLSLFRPQHRRWMPVTNADHDTTGMDDLMRMAMEENSFLEEEDEQHLSTTSYRVQSPPNDRLLTASSQQGMSDFEGPVFCHETSQHNSSSLSSNHSLASQQMHTAPSGIPVSSSVSDAVDADAFSSHQESFPQQENESSSRCRRRPLCGVSCFCNVPKATFPVCRPCLVVLSILVPLLCIGLCSGLGVYSLLVYKTDKLVIDKSVKSFSIPNHKVYKDFEAMMLARRDNSSAGRYKRDTTSVLTSFHQRPFVDNSFSQPQQNEEQQEPLFEKEAEHVRRTEEALRKADVAARVFARRRREAESSHNQNDGGFFSNVLHRIKRRSHEIGCLFEYQSIATWKMHVIYLAQGGSDHNMFTKERLETVHNIERQIMQHPGFNDFCLRDPHVERYDPAVRSMHGCVPLNSLMTYFYPSKDTQGHIFYDGMGSNIDDIDSALTLAMNHETFYYYVDDKINKTNKKSHLIRSEVLFGAPLPGFSCVGGHKDHNQQDEKFKDFVITYIDLLSAVSTEKVHVLYGGKEIFDYEVTTTFWNDLRLAIISLIAIFVLMLVLTLSLYLTVVGIIIIALSFPISLFFYRVVFEINALGILTGAAVFVIIGIGVDDVFVFVNIYRQAAHMKDPVRRIKYTVKTAGVATFFTSFTTAAAFAANLASSIPAVYDFGLFMALIVSSCWVSVFILMPPLLYFHACCVEPLETMLLSCFTCMTRRVYRPRAEDYSEDVSPLLMTTEAEEVGLYQEDDDVPMLDVQGAPENQLQFIENDDSPIDLDVQSRSSLSYSNTTTITTNGNNNMCFGRLIQKTVMFLTNRIVLPGRWLVIALFAVLLGTSCFLMSRLQPATHPPQLFRPDTNLQRLLDLKANFSIIDSLHCDRCSGLYKVHPSHSHVSGEKAPSTHHLPDSVPPPPTSKPSTHHHHKHGGSNSGSSSGTDGTTDYLLQPPGNSHHQPDPPTFSGSSTNSTVSHVVNQRLMDWLDMVHSASVKLVTVGLAGLVSSSSSAQMLEGNGSMVQAITPFAVKKSSAPSVPLTEAVLTEPSHLTTEMPHKQHHHHRHHTEKQTTTVEPKTIQPLYKERRRFDKKWYPAMAKRVSPSLSTSAMAQKVEAEAFKFILSDIRQTHPDWFQTENGGSLAENFNVCKYQRCNNLKDRPLMESGTTVYVVFGISGIDRSNEDVGHVLDMFKGKAVFDPKFANSFNIQQLNIDNVRELCRVCHYLSNMTELVKKGSAQCLPSSSSMTQLRHFLATIEECRDLPSSLSIYHHQAPAHAEGGVDREGRLLWLAFAFESTTKEGLAYSQAYKQYLKWEEAIQHVRDSVLAPDSPLRSIFQTSEFWTKVMMEVVAVNSAIYGLVLSMVICIISVAVFTGHLVLLVIVVVTIMVMICCVVGIFYLAGWEMGAVEAVSLSILVGSSVDYCVHIVEGYILAGRRMDSSEMKSQSARELRKKRTSQAVRHIGVAIVCSGLTTIIAAVPLTQTYIQPFTKFGSILLINTTISMLLTLTLATALLATFAPARFRGTWKSHLIAFGLVVTVNGLGVLVLYIMTKCGIRIPGPAGSILFS